ncbi:MAG: HAMP domain-containing sensor histidine kinase [Coriobacteriia bacterium]|nr:HAMP domain-containing sensor histidine kinase [Coriobacteriia bacterium]
MVEPAPIADRPAQRRRQSLTRRYLIIVIVAELLFGAFTATLVSGYSMQQAASDHRDTRRALTSAVAASLVGELATPGTRGLATALEALVGPGIADIQGAQVTGRGGSLLVRTGEWPADAVDDVSADVFQELVRPSIIHAPIKEGSRLLGYLDVVYRPVGLAPVLAFPFLAIALIVVVAVLFSSVWATVTMQRTVAIPVARLRDAAAAIAAGERRVTLPVERGDELGQLARAIDDMMAQLGQREKELIGSYSALESAYTEQAGLKDDLEAALRTRSDFFAVASHEIRSPLAVIRMYGEMLFTGEFGRLTKGQKDAVGSVSSAAARLTSIVADLMDVALLDRGLMPLTFGTIELDQIVDQAVHDAVALGALLHVGVEMQPGATGVTIRGDELRLRQVVDNILGNAVKYSDPAGPVRVQVLDAGDFAEVRIADQGPGIPEEKRGLLFELFRRVETEDNSSASGLGLGLAISRRIAQAHGGDITVEDNAVDGRGTVFIVRLPYHTDDEDGSSTRISVV